MFSFPRVIISDEKILENKKEIFKKSYNKTEDKIIVVTDFDFTLFNMEYITKKHLGVIKKISKKKEKCYIENILNMKKILLSMKI